MSIENRRRRWRDPDGLPRYLDDHIERSLFFHSIGLTTGANVLTSLMNPYDSIVEVSAFSEKITNRSLSALGWSVANYVQDLDDLFAAKVQVRSRLQIVALLLREFEAAVRQTWFQIAKANDATALRAEARGRAAGQGHKEQILYLAERFDLDPADRELWLTLPGPGALSKHVHHRFARPPSYDELLAIEDQHVKIFGLLKRLAQAGNGEYGWTLAYLARLLDGGPAEFDMRSQKALVYLQQSVPDNRRLRAWFLAQVPDQEWIVPLAKARFLGVGTDDSLTTAPDGTIEVPTVHSIRLLVRIVEDLGDIQHPGSIDRAVAFNDPATAAAVDAVIDEWLPAQNVPLNPRAHCDIAELLIRLGKAADPERLHRLVALYGLHTSYCSITRLVGDRGITRFPLQMARLASHLTCSGHRSLAYDVAEATHSALRATALVADYENFRAYCRHSVADQRLLRRLVKQ